MKRRTLPVLILTAVSLSLAALAPAQSVSEYLRMRKSYGVSHASSSNALQELQGSKVLEMQGVVKGSFRVGDRTSLLVDRPNGETQEVAADVVPDWLVNSETPARLLIRATRNEGSAALRVVLIAAAKETDIEPLEAKERARLAKIAAAKKAKAAALQAQSTRSMRGGVMYGAIGRGGVQPRQASRQWYLPASDVTPIYAAYIKHVNPRLRDGEAVTMAKAVVGFCIQYSVDPRLVMAMIFVESGFDPNSVSHSGAMGLGQLMPDTARWMGVTDPFDSIDNLNGMIKLIRTHLDTYNRQTGRGDESLVLTLAAYNAGEGAVRRHGGIPPYRETQRYVQKVLDLYYRMAGYS